MQQLVQGHFVHLMRLEGGEDFFGEAAVRKPFALDVLEQALRKLVHASRADVRPRVVKLPSQ